MKITPGETLKLTLSLTGNEDGTLHFAAEGEGIQNVIEQLEVIYVAQGAILEQMRDKAEKLAQDRFAISDFGLLGNG